MNLNLDLTPTKKLVHKVRIVHEVMVDLWSVCQSQYAGQIIVLHVIICTLNVRICNEFHQKCAV